MLAAGPPWPRRRPDAPWDAQVNTKQETNAGQIVGVVNGVAYSEAVTWQADGEAVFLPHLTGEGGEQAQRNER